MHIFDLIINLDKYAYQIIANYNYYFYIILFVVIFCETGLVITPFLPGDSLLFISGTIAATGVINIKILVIFIVIAAFLGDNNNYFIGRYIGKQLFRNKDSKIFKQSLLNKTQEFYHKHGQMAVILARFIPIFRTFVPFIAGIAKMVYKKFILFSIISSIAWVIVFAIGGFIFGNIPIIKSHISLIVLFIMIITLLPIIKIILNEFRK